MPSRSTTSHRRLTAAIMLAATMSLASPSFAQSAPKPAAESQDTEAMKEARRQLFKEALLAMSDKKWEECRVKTLGTWTAGKHPQVASLLGICEVELGLFRDGAEHLRYALDRGEGDQPIRGEQVKTAFAKALTKVGAVDVTATPEGVELRLGERIVGEAPTTLYFDPGEHQLEARHDGHATKLVQVSAKAGEKQSLAITLEPLASDLKGGDLVRPPGPGDERPDPIDEPTAKRPLWPAFVLGGVAAVGVGLGVTGFVVAGGARGDADDAILAAGPSGCGPDGAACAGVQSSLDQVNTMRGLGIGGFAVGGAALAGMIVYLVIPSSSEPGTGGLRLTPTFGSTNGLSLGGSF